jgi:DNA polymerase-1
VSYILDSNFAYKALNSLIQGTAADCTKHAMVAVYQFLKKYKSHMILTVHDEIIFEIHKDERHLIPDIAKIMSEAYPHKHLPLKVDIEYSKRSWGEKLDYNS